MLAGGSLFLVLFACDVAAPVTVRAQGSPRAWAMGGAAVAIARGLEAVDANPANLALAGPDRASLGLLTAAVDLSNNALTLDRYNRITGAVLDDADKAELLADIPPGGLSLAADVRTSALGLRVGGCALTLQGFAGGNGTLARDLFDLVLLGNPIGETFSFKGSGGEAFAVGALTFSAAAPVWTAFRHRLSVGTNLRYLRGLYELHVVEASGELVTSLDGISGGGEATLLSAGGGEGFGADLGIAWQAPRGWVFGLVLDNALGDLRWHRNVERRSWRSVVDTLNATVDDFAARLSTTDTTVAAAPYTTNLPRRLRCGVSNRWGATLWSLDLGRDLEKRPGRPAATMASAGAEWHATGWLLPRGGLAYDTARGASSAAGFGLRLGPCCLDVAAVNRGGLWPGDRRGLGLAVGSRLVW